MYLLLLLLLPEMRPLQPLRYVGCSWRCCCERGRSVAGGRLGAAAYVSIRQHTSAYVSIRQHTSAYVSIQATYATMEAVLELSHHVDAVRMLTYADVC
jgi:hypothetical protein